MAKKETKQDKIAKHKKTIKETTNYTLRETSKAILKRLKPKEK